MTTLAIGRRYLELQRRFPLRPIRDARAYARAAGVLDDLATVKEGRLSRDEQDYLDAVTLLVEDYDRRHPAFGPDRRTPLRKLKDLMDTSGTTQADLARLLGSRSAASMILKGARPLSRRHVRILADHFKIEAGYFV